MRRNYSRPVLLNIFSLVCLLVLIAVILFACNRAKAAKIDTNPELSTNSSTSTNITETFFETVTLPAMNNGVTYPVVHPHSYELVDTIDANCTENGKNILMCECGNIIEEIIPALNHSYKEFVENATCVSDGFKKNVCERCNSEEIIETYSATGHTYGKFVVIKEPTKWEYGSKERVCSVCGYKDVASVAKLDVFPIIDEGDGYKITITREWYKKAWVYAAHLEFTDYSRFGTECANGKYNNGYEKTSSVNKRLNAILTVNGCYSAPYLDYTVVRNGVIWNGADRNLWTPGIYSNKTGVFQASFGQNTKELVDKGIVTDTFCFGPAGLIDGVLQGKNEGARAQRTFMGTNGNAGDLWLVVSDGRYNDGESAGLTYYEGMEYLLTKGCTFGIHLDGGGSSTMVYRGHILNAVKKERAVVDFVWFK